MAVVNKKNIEAIFNKIDEEFALMVYSEKKQVLSELEKQAKTFNGEEVSDLEAIEIAFEKIKYYVARIYSEGKAKSTLANLKRCMDAVENEIAHTKNLINNERQVCMLKDFLTHLEITLNLDVSFHTSLLNVYEQCLEKKENVYFSDIQYKYQRRGR